MPEITASVIKKHQNNGAFDLNWLHRKDTLINALPEFLVAPQEFRKTAVSVSIAIGVKVFHDLLVKFFSSYRLCFNE